MIAEVRLWGRWNREMHEVRSGQLTVDPGFEMTLIWRVRTLTSKRCKSSVASAFRWRRWRSSFGGWPVHQVLSQAFLIL